MTTDDRDLEAAWPASATAAPATLAPNVLAEVGLADRYARFDSPIGPLVVAWNGLGVSAVEAASTTRRSRRTTCARTGRPAIRAERLPDRLATAIARRLDGDRQVRHRPRPARPHRLRARRLAQGARDPARRGPAVWLDRRRDRPAEGGPRGRDGARTQPGAAHRAVPPRRPDGRLDRPVLAGRAGEQAHDPRGRGPRPRRRWSSWRRPASGSSAPTRPRSSACRPAGTPAG